MRRSHVSLKLSLFRILISAGGALGAIIAMATGRLEHKSHVVTATPVLERRVAEQTRSLLGTAPDGGARPGRRGFDRYGGPGQLQTYAQPPPVPKI